MLLIGFRFSSYSCIISFTACCISCCGVKISKYSLCTLLHILSMFRWFLWFCLVCISVVSSLFRRGQGQRAALQGYCPRPAPCSRLEGGGWRAALPGYHHLVPPLLYFLMWCHRPCLVHCTVGQGLDHYGEKMDINIVQQFIPFIAMINFVVSMVIFGFRNLSVVVL